MSQQSVLNKESLERNTHKKGYVLTGNEGVMRGLQDLLTQGPQHQSRLSACVLSQAGEHDELSVDAFGT